MTLCSRAARPRVRLRSRRARSVAAPCGPGSGRGVGAHRAAQCHRIRRVLRAADIAESTGDRAVAFDCVARAVETHMNSIRQAGGFPLLDRLDALADTPAQTATALGQRAWYCSQLADDAGAVRYGAQALALAESTGTLSLVCQIRQRLATSLAMLGRFDDALPHLQAMLPWAQQHLPDEDLAEFHGNFAVVLDNLGLPEAAREHHERVLGTALASHDHAQRATALANHAVSRLNAGDVRQARQLVDQAQQLVAAYNLDGSSAGFVMVLQMQCARAQGHYAEALECAGHAERILHASNPARVPVVALHRAHCWLDLGQHARAQHDLQAAGGEQHLPRHFEARRLLLLRALHRRQVLSLPWICAGRVVRCRAASISRSPRRHHRLRHHPRRRRRQLRRQHLRLRRRHHRRNAWPQCPTRR